MSVSARAGACAIVVGGHDGRCTIGLAVDGDSERARCRQVVRVLDGVVEHLGQRLAGVQRIDVGVGVVQHIAVAAIGVDGQRAVLARHHRTSVGGHGGGAATCRGGRDRGHGHVGHDVVRVAVGRAVGLDVASGGGAAGAARVVFIHRVGIGRGHRRVVHRRDMHRGGDGVGIELPVAGRIAVGVFHLPADGAVGVAGVVAGADVGDGLEGREHVGDVSGAAAQGQFAGGGVVVFRPAARQRGRIQHVAGLETGGNPHLGLDHLGVVHVGERPGAGFERDGAAVLGESIGAARAAEHRGVVDRYHRHGARGGAGVGTRRTCPVRAVVVDRVGQRARGAGGVGRRVVGIRDVGQALQHLLVVGLAGGTAQGQHPGAAVVGGSNSRAAHIHRQRIARQEVAGDGDRGAVDVVVVRIGQGERVVHRDRRAVLGELGIQTRGGQHRAVHGFGDVERDAGRSSQRPASALVLPGALGRVTCMLVLVVDAVVELDAGWWLVAQVCIGDGLDDLVHTRIRRIGVEGDVQLAARVGEGTHHRGADTDVAAAEIDAGIARAGDAELVLGIGTAVALNGEYGAVPVRIEVELGVHQIDIGVDGDGGVFGVRLGCVQAGDGRRIVLAGRDEGEAARGGQITASAADTGAAVAQVVDRHGEGDVLIDVARPLGKHDVVRRGGDQGLNGGTGAGQGDGGRAVARIAGQACQRAQGDRPGTGIQGHGVVVNR